jgi:hypothetical protein
MKVRMRNVNLVEMQTPNTREEFENRLFRLHYSIVNNKMHFMDGISSVAIEDLVHMRSMPNGRMDLLTVDESARLNANMMVQMDGMLDEILGEDVQ